MNKETLDNICKPQEYRPPFYLNVRLSPLNVYRVVVFLLFLFSSVYGSEHMSPIQAVLIYAPACAAIVYILTSFSFWTKKERPSLSSVAGAWLLFLNAFAIFLVAIMWYSVYGVKG
ncbi:MAG: hypothetical protein PHO62_07950 [Sulfurimonas sp.]|uniref:hypothetical protein n=1 Tax=Sulfurimonas sp. TaxID=2022749 RepID=UPI00261AA2AF|nr:hypothetical protein [Sulfurimonas sp.]MDD5373340.1 hypothetical protein [Sulfurimonas sp.]